MRSIRRIISLGALLSLSVVAGCGSSGPKTYPVTGRVELSGGDVQNLTGSTIEAALESDPTVRASGEIKEDGTFSLETLHAGVILKGAQAGKYQVRILLGDDDKAARRRAAQALDPRYMQFKTSGLSIDVPADGQVTLQVTGRTKGDSGKRP